MKSLKILFLLTVFLAVLINGFVYEANCATIDKEALAKVVALIKNNPELFKDPAKMQAYLRIANSLKKK